MVDEFAKPSRSVSAQTKIRSLSEATRDRGKFTFNEA